MPNTIRPQNEYRQAINSLKRTLKSRKITYKELGAGIGLSESGVKKIFAAQDGSFQRLVEICRFVGVSIIEIIDDGKVVGVHYSKKQEDAFIKDPNLFYLYWCLVYERQSMDEAKRTLNLDDTKAFKLVRKLDLLNLIKLLPKNQIRVPSIKAIRWMSDGEFSRKIYREWSRQLVDQLAKPNHPDDEFFLLRYLQMKKNTYQEFLAALKTLEDEFVRRAIHEMRTSPNNLKHVRWLVATDNSSFIENSQIQAHNI